MSASEISVFKHDITTFSDNELIGYYVFLRLVPISILPSELYRKVLAEFTKRRIDSSIIVLNDPNSITASSTEPQKETYRFKLQFFQEYYADAINQAKILQQASRDFTEAKRNISRYTKRVETAKKAVAKATERTRAAQQKLVNYLEVNAEKLQANQKTALRRKATLEKQLKVLTEKEQLRVEAFEEATQLLKATQLQFEKTSAILETIHSSTT